MQIGKKVLTWLSKNKTLIFILITSISIYISYYFGYSAGSDARLKEYQENIISLQESFRVKENEWNKKNTEISLQLADAKKEYEESISSLTGSFNDKLRQSEARASIYRSQASSSESERRSLASHAAKLDRCLTEGQQVVRELRSTVELRDKQIKLLGDELIALKGITK